LHKFIYDLYRGAFFVCARRSIIRMRISESSSGGGSEKRRVKVLKQQIFHARMSER
jgi:hypothetical protein